MEGKNKYIFKEVCMNIFVNCIFIYWLLWVLFKGRVKCVMDIKNF